MVEYVTTERKNSLLTYITDRQNKTRKIAFHCKICDYHKTVDDSNYNFDFVCPNCNHTLLSPNQVIRR